MKQLLCNVFVALMLFATATVFAKTINLYSEPKPDSKVAGTINSDTGITIVYTPKNSEWIKVANPSNGGVGWIKSSELGGKGYNMRVFTSGDGAHSYSFYQFGNGTSQFDQKQLENEVRNLQQHQHMIQAHMTHMLNDMFYFPQPIFIPVVMMPAQQKTAHATTTTPGAQTKQVNKS